MKSVIATIERAAQGLGQAVLAFMVITICYDAIMRYLFTAPTSWSLEINTFLIIYVAAMTAAGVQRTDSHIRISFFADLLGARAQRMNRVAIGLSGAVFSGIMAWCGYLITYQSWDYGDRVSSSFGTPLVFPYAMLPIGFGLLTIRFVIDILDAITGHDKTRDDLQNI